MKGKTRRLVQAVEDKGHYEGDVDHSPPATGGGNGPKDGPTALSGSGVGRQAEGMAKVQAIEARTGKDSHSR